MKKIRIVEGATSEILEANVNRVLEEVAKDDLSVFIPKMDKPFSTHPRSLYTSKMLYEGYD